MGGLVEEIFLKCARVCQLIWAEWCTWKETEWICLIKSLWCTIGCWVRHIWVLWGVTNYLLNTLSLPLLLPASPLTPHSSLVTPFFVAQSELHLLHVHCIAPHHPHPITYLWLPWLNNLTFSLPLLLVLTLTPIILGLELGYSFWICYSFRKSVMHKHNLWTYPETSLKCLGS